MNYAVMYRGNFIRSIEALERQLQSESAKMIYVFPEKAKTRDWVIKMVQEGKTVCFLPSKFVAAALLLRKIIRQYDISIIHSHFMAWNIYFPIKLARLGNRGVSHIVHAHNIPNKLKNPLLNSFRNFLIAEKLYICVSEAVASEYTSRGRKCVVVRNAVDFSRLNVFENLDRKEYCASESQKLIFLMGYNFKIKGTDFAIKAFNRLDKEHLVTLLICVASHIEQAKEQIIDILGDIPPWIRLLPPRDDIASYYKLADIVASPSRTEAFNTSLIEAAYCGLPIVASDVPGQNELKIPFTQEFESENDEQFVSAVWRLLSCSNDQRRNETAQAKEYVEKNFMIENWAKRITEIYSKLS